MGTLRQDLRYALRGLNRSRAFAAIAILTIGIGIGANTTVYSWMHALLLNPLPGAVEPDRVAAVENVAANGDPLASSYLDFRDFRDHLRSFEAISAVHTATLAVGDESTQPVWGELVSGDYFELMGLRPEIGRFFSGAERDDTQNAHAVAVISYSFWKARYNLSASAIGSTLRINHTPMTIIGVTPPSFHGSQTGLDFELWLPATMYGHLTHTGTSMLNDRNNRNWMLLGRLKPGVTVEQARSEVKALASRLAAMYPDTNQGVGADVLPVWKGHFTPQAIILAPIAILMCASALLLLIVCANVANLLLARATGRQQEFSIRLAIGAGRARLVQQLLTETLILALAGAAAGLSIASWLGSALRWLLPRVASPAVLQPGEHHPVTRVAVAQHPRTCVRQLAVHRGRQPQLKIEPGLRSVKAWRCDTDDRERRAVDSQGCSDGRLAEVVVSLPERMADHCDRMCVLRVIALSA